jgi:hypothetical protein
MARNHRERSLPAGQGKRASTRPMTITKKITPTMNCMFDRPIDWSGFDIAEMAADY